MSKETLLFAVIKEYELQVKDKKRLAENYAQAGLTEYYEKTMEDLKEYEEILSVYYQIKAELEAWESIKPNLKITGSFLTMRFITIDHPSFRKIEKLIEVNNNENN